MGDGAGGRSRTRRRPTTSAPRTAGSGRPTTPAAPGRRSSSTRPRRPSARSPSRPRDPNVIYVGHGPDPRALGHRRRATASTAPTTAARPGPTLGLDATRTSAASWWTRATRTWCWWRRWATSSGRTRSAASTAPPTAGELAARSPVSDETGAVDLAGDPGEPRRGVRRAWQMRSFPGSTTSSPRRARAAASTNRRRRAHWAPARGHRSSRPDRSAGSGWPWRAGRERVCGADRRGRSTGPGDPGGPLPLGRRRRHLGAHQRHRRSRASYIDRGSPSRPDESDTIYVDGAVDPAVHRRRQDLRVLQGRARRRRLPLPLDQPEGPAVHDRRRRPGRGGEPERRPDLEQLVQPAHRPVLPPRRRTTGSPTGSTAASRTTARSASPAAATTASLDVPRLASGRRRRARHDVPEPERSRASSTAPGWAARHALGRTNRTGRRTSRPGRSELRRAPHHGQATATPGSRRSRSRRARPMRSTWARSICFRSLDDGAHWRAISPDLTGAEPGDGRLRRRDPGWPTRAACGFGVDLRDRARRRRATGSSGWAPTTG